MKLTDFPRPYPLSSYEAAIGSMVDRLKSEQSVKSIYQIGGVSSPGISDIDILVIFHNNQKCHNNPLSDLTNDEKYFYIHNLFGMAESHFIESLSLPFFHSYKHLWGYNHNPVPNEAVTHKLKVQIALEYLVKMFITMTIERTYGIMKIRNLLLHIKALLIDVEYLGVKSGAIFDLLNQITQWRSEWFDASPDSFTLQKWYKDFYHELESLLKEHVNNKSFYIPEWVELSIARNIMLKKTSSFNIIHKGITLPSALGGLGRKYFNIQNRLNKFVFEMDIGQSDIPDDISARHNFIVCASDYNALNIPHFIPVAYGLSIYRRQEVA